MQKLKWVCSFESLQVCVDVSTMYVLVYITMLMADLAQ